MMIPEDTSDDFDFDDVYRDDINLIDHYAKILTQDELIRMASNDQIPSNGRANAKLALLEYYSNQSYFLQ